MVEINTLNFICKTQVFMLSVLQLSQTTLVRKHPKKLSLGTENERKIKMLSDSEITASPPRGPWQGEEGLFGRQTSSTSSRIMPGKGTIKLKVTWGQLSLSFSLSPNHHNAQA